MVGKTLGHYEILEPLGAGGMGEVYRARDTKLDRDVAIKVLPEDFATDPERLARFEREAKLLASLNHANIAAIYGLEDEGDQRFIVMEVVEGETLAEQIARSGRIEVDEALEIARQIAEALEAAHENGVIHRDLKPANVIVTPEGKVKVLDFGLAKAYEADGSLSEISPDLSASPTMAAATRTGVIMGTAAYMSPEQAKGKSLDKRTDIWSFGCALYEMLTGRNPFAGEDVSDTLASILKDRPNWEALPAETPLIVRALLRRCLRKDPDRRLHDIADARIEIEEALGEPLVEPTAVEAVAAARAPLRVILPWALAVLGLAGGSVAIWTSTLPSSGPAAPVRFSDTLSGNETLALGVGASESALAISRDGTKIAYVVGQGVDTQIHLRRMDQLRAIPISGTEGGGCPFFSPDGESLGFFVQGQVRTISLAGGAPVTVAPSGACRGASWGTDGMIIYAASTGSGLWRVSPTPGSEPEPLTRPDRDLNERSYRWPQFIPEAGAVLFTVAPGDITSFDEAHVALVSLDTGEQRILTQGTYGRYLPTGHLVFGRAGSILAVPFDLERLEITGSPTPVVNNVVTHPITGAAQFAVSDTGVLAYVPGGSWEAERRLVWVDRTGSVDPVSETRRPFFRVDLSPDGSRLAVEIQAATNEIWVAEMAPFSLVRLTFGWENRWPVWNPDGTSIAFSSERTGVRNVFQKRIDPGASAEPLTVSDHEQAGAAWGPTGEVLLFTERAPSTGDDVWVLRVGEDAEPEPLIDTEYQETGAVLSPDGRWLAYTSNESEQLEVYVRPFPDMDWQRLISSDGGHAPLWGPKGRELFYWNRNALMRVAVSAQTEFEVEPPELLFELEGVLPAATGSYDITPDGERFLMIESELERSAQQLNFVLNWFEELKQRVPTGR